jgi:hypothetical protein
MFCLWGHRSDVGCFNFILKRFPDDCDKQQLQLIYISLYLLIWGEASNVRFMPECICYIFHNMANDVYGILFSNVEAVSGETYETEEVIDEESFLRTVITPIYQVIRNVSISKSIMLYIFISNCTLSFE